jgi:hypothetical protein
MSMGNLTDNLLQKQDGDKVSVQLIFPRRMSFPSAR